MQATRFWLALVALGCATVLGFPVAVAAGSAARVTATEGDAPVGDGGSLADGQAFETGADGKCALLMDGDAAMEVCGDTSIRLESDPSGRRIVKLSRGRMRIAVEPRSDAARIEIHTPAAIATLLGTIAYFEVDPATGETTVTSAESRVLVASAQTGVEGQTTLQPLEQVEVRPGLAPPEARRLGQGSLPDHPGCRFDYRRAALEDDREDRFPSIADRMTQRDANRAMRTFGESFVQQQREVSDPGPPDNDPSDPYEACGGVECSAGVFDQTPTKPIR